MSDINERFAKALHSTARAWRLAMDRRLRYLGLSQAGWITIAMVAKSPEPLSQKDLAHRIGVEGATMVAMIDRLAKAGLVERELSPTDRRVKYVKLTDAGHGVFGRVRSESAVFRDGLLKDIDRCKLAEALELLEKIQELLEPTP